MSNSFNDLGLSEPILRALKEMEFEKPTEIQAKAIPHILRGKDVSVASKTGSGKTAVFGVSVLELTDAADKGPQCLILVPTRELAVQVDNDLKKMAKYVNHTSTAVYGQHNMNTEIRALEKNVTIVTGTPGRVFDHIEQGTLRTRNIKFLVLDEVDRMMDMGFIDQVRRIIRTLPKERVTLLFSATIPEEIARLCRQYMNDPVNIEIQSETRTVDTIEQRHYRVERNEKRTQLGRLLLMERPETCMIFCNTKIAVDQVQNYLTRKGYASRALHGDIPQNRRMKNIQQFKKGTYHILVATDVAARGIHVEDLSLVINYDVPQDLDNYIHRIGRTGRAGHEGKAISLVTSDDIMTIYQIEEHIGALIPEAQLPTDEELAEQKELSDAWVKAHALRHHSGKQQPGTSTGKAGGGSRNKPYRKKPYHKGERKQEHRPREAGHRQDGGAKQKQQSKHHQKKQAAEHRVATEQGQQRQGQQRQGQRPYAHQKDSHTGGKSSGTQSKQTTDQRHRLERKHIPERKHTEAAKSQPAVQPKTQTMHTTEKKPFLKRIFGKILGK